MKSPLFTKEQLIRLKKEGKIDFDERELEPKKGKSKYRNQKTELDGIVFDSAKEARRYMELRMLQTAGEIKDLRLQVEFKLEVNGEKVASYYADFTYYLKTGEYVVEDVKSKATRRIPVYRLKKKLLKSIYNIEIKEI